MPSSMPARTAVDCAARQLVVELPLQPPVEIDGFGVLGGEVGDRGTCRGCEFLRPVVPVRSVPLCQRTPDREGVEAAAFAFAVCRVCQLTTGRALHPVHALQHVALGLPCRVPVDQVRASRVLLQVDPCPADAAAVAHIRELGDGLWAQVDAG